MGLRDEIKVDAFLAGDLSAIYVDEHTLQFIPARYRFSLAHAVGHSWLHDELYQDTRIASVADWRGVCGDLGDDYSSLSFHQHNLIAAELLFRLDLEKMKSPVAMGHLAQDASQEGKLRANTLLCHAPCTRPE